MSMSFLKCRALAGWWLGLLLAAISLVSLPGQSQSAILEWEVWSDPQIDLPVPRGWHRTELTWVAERILIATPTPPETELSVADGGLDAPAVIHVKIDALDSLLFNMPLAEIAGAMVEEISGRLEAEGLDHEVLERSELTVGDREAFKVVVRQDTTVSHVLLFRTEGYLYEVTVGYEQEHGAAYEALVAPVLAGVRPKSPPADSIALEFRTTLLARLPAPSGWHERTTEGELPQVIISQEDARGAGRRYQTGISLLKIPLNSEVSPSGLGELYGIWLESYVAEMSGGPFRLIQAGEILLDSGPSFLIEASFQDPQSGSFTQLFNVITAVGDRLYIATFEAPVETFHLVRPAFLESIARLEWR